MGVPELEKREKGADHSFEGIMADNIPNLRKAKHKQIQEAQITPTRIDLYSFYPNVLSKNVSNIQKC